MAETGIAQTGTATPAKRFEYVGNAKVGSPRNFKALLDQMKERLIDVLPKHITPERLVKTALTAAIRQPRLYECTQESIMESIIRAGELGLDCSGGPLGQGYLVPFANNKKGTVESVFIPGYRGLIDLARRTGEVKVIEAYPVYEKDNFEIELGTNPRVVHKPYYRRDARRTPNDVVLFYFVAQLASGETQIDYMTREEIEAIRRRSRASNDGPWVTDWIEMGRKTMCKRGCKYIPLSPEKAELLQRAIEFDNDALGSPDTSLALPAPSPMEASHEAPQSRTEALANRLQQEKAQPPVQEEPTPEPSAPPAPAPTAPAVKESPKPTPEVNPVPQVDQSAKNVPGVISRVWEDESGRLRAQTTSGTVCIATSPEVWEKADAAVGKQAILCVRTQGRGTILLDVTVTEETEEEPGSNTPEPELFPQ